MYSTQKRSPALMMCGLVSSTLSHGRRGGGWLRQDRVELRDLGVDAIAGGSSLGGFRGSGVASALERRESSLAFRGQILVLENRDRSVDFNNEIINFGHDIFFDLIEPVKDRLVVGFFCQRMEFKREQGNGFARGDLMMFVLGHGTMDRGIARRFKSDFPLRQISAFPYFTCHENVTVPDPNRRMIQRRLHPV